MHFFFYKYKRTCFIYNNVWLQFLLLFYMVILLLKYAYIHLGELLITIWNLWLWAMSHWKNTSHVFVSLYHLFQQGRKSQAEAGHFLHCAGKKKTQQIKYKASEIFLDEGVTFFQAQWLVSGAAWSALELWMSLRLFSCRVPRAPAYRSSQSGLQSWI